MRKLFLIVAGLALLSGACKVEKKSTDAFDSIIPRPAHIEWERGTLQLQPGANVAFNDSSLNFEAQWLSSFLKSDSKEGNPQIRLSIGNVSDTLGDEGYILNIEKDGITIEARSSAGVFYGIQSLRQLLPPEVERDGLKQVVSLPLGRIIDKPRFVWRGLLLDCCRHFMDKDFVLRYIDLLAMQKMNRLHWHLTEDQGWRIEIKKYPKLTEVGAWRMESDSTRYGGYYSQDEIREVIAYAAERHIEIIPEIEMPGHSLAALAAYPELSCTGGPFTVETNWGVFKDIYCAGNEKVFEFMEGVLTEVAELFPSTYIHIGGDEAPRYRWENCERCQTRMQTEGLKEEAQLQTYFIERVASFLEGKGKKIIGWDEILEGGLMKGATVQSWRGMKGALEAIEHGHDAIVSPTSHAYFDYHVSAIDVEKVYSFNPIPEGISASKEKHVLGAECNMWTERAPQNRIDQKLYPRILAMAEVMWSPLSARDYSHFTQRLQAFYARLDLIGVEYGPETETVRFVNRIGSSKRVYAELLPGQKGTELRYQLKDPQGKLILEGSSTDPVKLAIGRDATLKVDAMLKSGSIIESFERSYSIHKGLGRIPVYKNLYSPNYKAAGDRALLDGVLGTWQFRDGNWQGFEGVDMDVLIDLGKHDTISYVAAGFLQSAPSWIFMPSNVEVQLMAEKGKVLATYRYATKVAQTINEDTTELCEFRFTPIVVRYLRVSARNVGVCPPWHPGAGGKSWVFADEIVIK